MLQSLSNSAGERGFSYVGATSSCPAQRGTSPVHTIPAEVVMPRAAEGVSGFTGEVYLALDRRSMTAADQGDVVMSRVAG